MDTQNVDHDVAVIPLVLTRELASISTPRCAVLVCILSFEKQDLKKMSRVDVERTKTSPEEKQPAPSSKKRAIKKKDLLSSSMPSRDDKDEPAIAENYGAEHASERFGPDSEDET